MKISLIITTYNWPEALSVILDSVLGQTRHPHDVIIADDGSGPETADVVLKMLKASGLRWRHVWHEDKGIRQARIKNLGVRYAEGDYFIFIDHDVALHPAFVEDHAGACVEGCFLQGKRVFLPESMSKRYMKQGIFSPPSPFVGKLENRKNAFRIPSVGRVIGRQKVFQRSLRGCNLSMYRKDFMAVDGYDETFDQLWGREDSDICYRLYHNGVKIVNLWFSALQYHLHHDSIKNKTKDRLDQELERCLRTKRKRALHGFSHLSQEGYIVTESMAL